MHYYLLIFKEWNKAGQSDCVPLQPRPQEQEHNAQFYRAHAQPIHIYRGRHRPLSFAIGMHVIVYSYIKTEEL